MKVYYTVGVIAGTHGVRGEVKVLSRTDFEQARFRPGSMLYLRAPGEDLVQSVEVRTARRHKQFWLLAFEGWNAASEVESWRGRELCVDASQLAPLPEGTYYFHQLVGLQVVSEDGLMLGRLAQVLTPGANDVYVVRPESGRNRGRELLIPAIPECVREVDLDRKVMKIHLMPGLIDDEVLQGLAQEPTRVGEEAGPSTDVSQSTRLGAPGDGQS